MPYFPGDSRSFTDYRSGCLIEKELKEQNGVNDNFSYRLYLQKNAKTIMQNNLENAYRQEYTNKGIPFAFNPTNPTITPYITEDNNECVDCGKKIMPTTTISPISPVTPVTVLTSSPSIP